MAFSLGKEIAFFRGNAALSRGDSRGAMEVFQQAVDAHPEDAGLWLRLAAAQEDKREFTAAEASYRRASALEPWNLAITALTGVFYLMQDRSADALPLFESVLAGDETQPLALAGKGFALLKADDPTGVDLLTKEVGNTSARFQSAVLAFAEGVALERAGTARLVESLLITRDRPSGRKPSLWSRFEAALSRRPAEEVARADQLLEAGKYEEAEALLKLRVEKNPRDEESSLYLGFAYLLGGKPRKALTQAKAAGAGSPVAVRLQGLSELILGRLAEARAVLAGNARESIDALDHHLLGIVELSEGKRDSPEPTGRGGGAPRKELENARRQFERALDFAPEDWTRERLEAYRSLS